MPTAPDPATPDDAAPGSAQPGDAPPTSHRTISYADAGVDLDAADRSVALIGQAVARTHGPEVLAGIGGFGGLFAFDPSRYRDPVLVSGTDGVGTKVDLARRMQVYDTIGRDLVAMVVDDLVVVGATPLFVNDYVSVGMLDPQRVATIVGGIADGCADAGCALVGGETAEHPGVLAPDAFDLAGFGVAVVERDAILGADRVEVGDTLIAMASSGVHSNGFSLVRQIVDARLGMDLTARHGLHRPLGQVLLEPTRIYARDVLALIDEVEVHALCHVTGGGLPGNLPRVLPDGAGAVVDAASWQWPAIFSWLQEHGPIDDDEMWRTFNCGVGMVAIVPSAVAAEAVACLEQRGVPSWVLGEVVASTEPQVTFVGR